MRVPVAVMLLMLTAGSYVFAEGPVNKPAQNPDPGGEECGLAGRFFGLPIGAAAGGITVAWLTK